MKKILTRVLAIAAVGIFAMTPFLSAQTSASMTVTADFEGTSIGEGNSLTSQIPGLTISGGKLVIEGAPQLGFGSQYDADTVDSGACFDNAFLRPISTAAGAVMTIAFDAPTDVLAFTLGDIDPTSIATEGVEIRAYDSGGVVLQSLSIWSDDPDTGDGHGTRVEFSVTGIKSIEIKNLAPVAYGIDNINLQSCPEYVDWTSASGSSASGTLCGSTVTASGTIRTDLVTTNGAYTGFNESHFTPSVADTDSIGTQTSNPMTLNFSPPLADPTLHIRQLANTTLTFTEEYILLSSDGDFITTPNSIRGVSSADDANGSLLFSGSFTELSWTVSDDNTEDGMWLQLSVDNCVVVTDSDDDGVPDEGDNCPDDANTDQADLDDDGLGDICDDDADGDGEPPPLDCNDLDSGIFTTAIEICTDGIDNDCDLLIDAADDGGDCDGDTVPNGLDNCPDDANPGQADLDGDGSGDVCDSDDDGDGYEDGMDNCPVFANDQADLDDDGVGDACDDDADGDSVNDAIDRCLSTASSDMDAGVPSKRLGKNRWADIDGDGLFDTSGKNPTGRYFTIDDTAGCNCAQIIETCGYGKGHIKHGCSNSVMDSWTGTFDREGEAPYQCK